MLVSEVTVESGERWRTHLKRQLPRQVSEMLGGVAVSALSNGYLEQDEPSMEQTRGF